MTADIAGWDIVCIVYDKHSQEELRRYSCESYQDKAEAQEVLAAYIDDRQANEGFVLVPLTQAEWDERYDD